MNKQIQLYSLDTSDFYNESELKIHKKLSRYYFYRSYLKKIINQTNMLEEKKEKASRYRTNLNKRIKSKKELLINQFNENKNIRVLHDHNLQDNKIISAFESVLTRTLELPANILTKDLFVVQTYHFNILKDIIYNGFTYNNEKYIFFTASAGQIRTKKTLFIKESSYLKHSETLMCGLSNNKINHMNGVNINKFLAYLALCNSTTEIWDHFNIDKTIVVEDMETMVTGVVDYIHNETYDITRKKMNVLINHTDGCGMMLPKISKKNFMIRLPWVKGLLVAFPFDKFIKEQGVNASRVKDIYGKEYDVIKDDIQIILTRSQFKMHKYYESWDEYKTYFKQFQCHAAKCNEEESHIHNKRINYQMIQTLSDFTDEELVQISEKSRNEIKSIGTNYKTMLKVLGVDKTKPSLNHFQQAVNIYPEILTDTYSRAILKQIKKSLVSEAKLGKIHIDGKYTFICPDLYAFCEYLFTGQKKPNGLLNDGEVFCSLYESETELDCLRSPHLYKEHAIRCNVVDDNKKKWFITKGLYTSSHDLISKLLQFDVDGDQALVCSDETLVSVAKRNMKDVVPLLYDMKVSQQQQLNHANIYDGLVTAYTGGNIGTISNDITKIWNSESINLDAIKWLCAENNYTIDFAKTLYKPTRPKEKKIIISSYTRNKSPYFLKHANNENDAQFEKWNTSTMNRLEKIITNPRLQFKTMNLGEFDYSVLMKNKEVSINENIVEMYTKLDLNKKFISNNNKTEKEYYTGDNLYIYTKIRNEITETFKQFSIDYIVDVLVKYLYLYKKSNYKTTLWSSFGDIIVKNISSNISDHANGLLNRCEVCGLKITKINSRIKYCETCSKERSREQTRRRVQYHRQK
ncbi:hypothetical protein [Paenibacillus sp. NPDC058174]|uniref:RNA dependent RNA polymerase n=1 Tax=Paenibacillus sp. NPDC058174 TaxID=3346366 RepID=UPI0036D7EF0C